MDRLTADVASVPTASQGSAARLKARIIIPVWGAKYIAKLDAACLPALLAPGNLPHLAKHFDCELVVVTQAESFELVRTLPGVRAAAQYAPLKLVAMDDVMSHPSYYGYTITHALYRGFSDLGDAAKDVWCLFLNADFILADGSYRALTERMLAGERCILSPSYCTIEEDVRPVLNASIAQGEGVLALPPRRMAELILDHRHYTIRAKTINWHMYRIDHVDQFYYAVDRHTLLGRQIPIAVVALRPERVPVAPVAFWDYGVISEVIPSGKICVLGDSDDFLMMELRVRKGMSNWLKLGWMEKDEIARSLSRWSTRDQRMCAAFPLALHSRDMPQTAAGGFAALDAYWMDVKSRMTPEPQSHHDHYIWTGTLDLHAKWLGGLSAPNPAGEQLSRGSERPLVDLLGSSLRLFFGIGSAVGRDRFRRSVFDCLQVLYRAMFGRLPDVGFCHPQRVDLLATSKYLQKTCVGAKRALSIWSLPRATVAPFLKQWIPEVFSAKSEDLLHPAELARRGPFDVCFLELARDEIVGFGKQYSLLRPMMKPGGKVIVFYQTRGMERVKQRDATLIHSGLPGEDLPRLEFRGGFLSHSVQAVWESLHDRLENGGTREFVRFALLATLLAPFAALANAISSPHPGRHTVHCTSLLLEVTVV